MPNPNNSTTHMLVRAAIDAITRATEEMANKRARFIEELSDMGTLVMTPKAREIRDVIRATHESLSLKNSIIRAIAIATEMDIPILRDNEDRPPSMEGEDTVPLALVVCTSDESDSHCQGHVRLIAIDGCVYDMDDFDCTEEFDFNPDVFRCATHTEIRDFCNEHKKLVKRAFLEICEDED